MTPSLFRNVWAGFGPVVRGRRGDQHLRSVVNKVHASFGFALGIAREGERADCGVDGNGANITSLRDRVGWRYRMTNLIIGINNFITISLACIGRRATVVHKGTDISENYPPSTFVNLLTCTSGFPTLFDPCTAHVVVAAEVSMHAGHCGPGNRMAVLRT